MDLGKPVTLELFEGEGPGEVNQSQQWITSEKDMFKTVSMNPTKRSGFIDAIRAKSEVMVAGMAKIWQTRVFEDCDFGCFILKIKSKLYLIKMLKNVQSCTTSRFYV